MKIKGSRLAVAAVAVAAFGAASAASLGGLSSDQVGANDTVVAACDSNGVSMSYTTAYDDATASYQVTEATVSGIAAPCIGQTLDLTVSDAAGVALGDGTVVVAGASETITGLAVPAEGLRGAAVIISTT